jgi:phage head maturation protease
MAGTIKRGEQEMRVSSLNFQVKEVGVPEERRLQFIGSDETPDRDGDVISVGGWDLSNYKTNPVFLWAHDYSIPPVGKATNVYTEKGKLLFDIQFPEKGIYPFADLVYNLYKGGFLNATSVGFIGKEAEQREDDAVKDLPEWRRGVKFMKQELLELSAVPVPSNPSALQQAKSIGAVTDDEYTSLMSFINGDFVQNPHIGAKTLKGIKNVYESQESNTNAKEVEPVGKENEQEKSVEQKFSFVLNPVSQRTLLLENTSGKILGDMTEEVKSLISQAVEAAKASFSSEEKAGAVLSKKNKGRLSQAKDLIIEVLGQVEDEQGIEDQKDPAVLQDEEELNKPEDVSMVDSQDQKDAKVCGHCGKKCCDECPGESCKGDCCPDCNNGGEAEPETEGKKSCGCGSKDDCDKCKSGGNGEKPEDKTAEKGFVLELEDDDSLDISEEDVAEMVKAAVASLTK